MSSNFIVFCQCFNEHSDINYVFFVNARGYTRGARITLDDSTFKDIEFDRQYFLVTVYNARLRSARGGRNVCTEIACARNLRATKENCIFRAHMTFRIREAKCFYVSRCECQQGT